jgi:hypothetical protein
MSDSSDEFDDPALKEALRRAFAQSSDETAPPALRRRVEAILSAGAGADAVNRAGDDASRLHRPQRSWWRQQMKPRTAIAAAVALIAVGFMVVQIRSQFGLDQPTVPYVATSFPESLTTEMVQAHLSAAKAPEALKAIGKTPADVKASLSKAAGVTVAGSELGSGWQYRGARLLVIDGQKAAQLLFTKGQDSVSVFSMGAPSECEAGSGSYKQVVNGHPMAGIVSNGAVYCIVGSSPAGTMSPSDLEPLLSTVQSDVAEHGCAPAPSPITAALTRRLIRA